MFADLAAKYGMKVLAVLLAVAVVVGGYYYIKHQGAVEQAAEDAALLAERNAAEKADYDAQWNAALTNVVKARETDSFNYSKDISHYAQITADSAATLERMRKQPRVPASESRGAASGRETHVSGGGAGGIGTAGCEVSESKRIEIAKMAELALLVSAHVRRTSNVR